MDTMRRKIKFITIKNSSMQLEINYTDLVSSIEEEVSGIKFPMTDETNINKGIVYNVSLDEQIVGTLFFCEKKYNGYLNMEIIIDITSDQSLSGKYEKEIGDMKKSIKNYLIKKGIQKIFWLEDYQSEHYNQLLSNKFYLLENRFRNLINFVMINQKGSDWFINEAPYSFRRQHQNLSENYREQVTSFSGVDDTLYCMLTDDLVDILKKEPKKLKDSSPNKIEALLHTLMKQLDGKSKHDSIKRTILNQFDKNTPIFNEYFNGICDRIILNKWGDLSKKRNHIAHNKLIDSELFESFSSEIDDFDAIIDTSLKNAVEKFSNY
ncbi:hypothetical protein, partial [Trichococcus flocculiformis]